MRTWLKMGLEDNDDAIWQMTSNQRAFYLSQFLGLNTQQNNTLSGAQVKDYFEKSKLSVQELSHIWTLSDVDEDGALSFKEFCVAMHLIVLRRNGVFLPEVLPAPLLAVATANSETFIEQQVKLTKKNDLEKHDTDDQASIDEMPRFSSAPFSSDKVSLGETNDYTSFQLCHPIARHPKDLSKPVINPPPLPPRRSVRSTNKPFEMDDFGLISVEDPSELDKTALIAAITALRRNCNALLKGNNEMGMELARFQQQRIALEILLEHLTPLDESI